MLQKWTRSYFLFNLRLTYCIFVFPRKEEVSYEGFYLVLIIYFMLICLSNVQILELDPSSAQSIDHKPQLLEPGLGTCWVLSRLNLG